MTLPGQQLEHRRQRAHADAALAARPHDLHPQPPGRRRDRDDDLVGLGLVEDLRQLARRPAHAHAVDAQPLLERVVVDEADRVQAELGVARELLADLAAALAGADDQHVALVVARAQARQAAVVDRAREHARRGQEREREQEEEDDHAAGQADRGRHLARRGGAGRSPHTTGCTTATMLTSSTVATISARTSSSMSRWLT